MIEVGDVPLQRQAEGDADQLERQQHQRQQGEGEDDEAPDHGQTKRWPRPDRRGCFLARSGPDRKLAKSMIRRVTGSGIRKNR